MPLLLFILLLIVLLVQYPSVCVIKTINITHTINQIVIINKKINKTTNNKNKKD
jgi:hypothetical protein